MLQAKKFLFFDKHQLPCSSSSAAGDGGAAATAPSSAAGVARLQAVEMTCCAAGSDSLLLGDAKGNISFVTHDGRRLFSLEAHVHRVTAAAYARRASVFVTVGDGATVGAGAVVTKSVVAGATVVGANRVVGTAVLAASGTGAPRSAPRSRL